MMPVIVPSNLMIALSTLNIIGLLICWSSFWWLLTLDGPLLEESFFVKMVVFMTSNLDWGFCNVSVAEITSKYIRVLFVF